MYHIIKYSLIFLTLSFITFTSCREDDLLEVAPTTYTPIEKPEEFYTTDLNGIVIDDAGEIVANATIVIGEETVSTNQFGLFSASNINAPSTGLYVKVLKDGYFTGGTHYFPNEPTTSTLEITVLRKEQNSFDAIEGYEGELAGGAKVIIPSSGVQRNGQDYNGTVNISSVWLNPEEEETFNTMPGALIAQNQLGETQFLETFGMIAVEMTDNLGQKLQLKEGSLAELTFPLSTNLQGSAPTTICLLYTSPSPRDRG